MIGLGVFFGDGGITFLHIHFPLLGDRWPRPWLLLYSSHRGGCWDRGSLQERPLLFSFSTRPSPIPIILENSLDMTLRPSVYIYPSETFKEFACSTAQHSIA